MHPHPRRPQRRWLAASQGKIARARAANGRACRHVRSALGEHTRRPFSSLRGLETVLSSRVPTVPADLQTLHLLRLVAANPTPDDEESAAVTTLLPGDLRRLLFASDLSREEKTRLAHCLPPGRVRRLLKPSIGILLAFAQVLAEDACAGDPESLGELADMLDIPLERAQKLVTKHRASKARLRDGPTVAARALVAEFMGIEERNVRSYVDKRWAGTRRDPSLSQARQWITRARRCPTKAQR